MLGVAARGDDGSTIAFKARGGVVLATGDFSADREMKAEHASATVAKTEPVNALSTGDGHRLALAVGARIVNGDIVHGPRLRFVPPARASLVRRLPPWRVVGLAAKFAAERLPDFLLRPVLMGFVTTALGVEANLYKHGAILVNKEGRRFADELGNPQDALPDQPGAIAFAILDGAIAEAFSRWPNFVSTAPGVAYAYIADYRRNRRDVFHEAPSLEALAQKIGVPADAPHPHRRREQRAGRSRRPCAADARALHRARAHQALCRLHRRRPRRERAARGDRPRRRADPRPLRGGLDRPGRPAALRPRPSSRLGVRVGADRGARGCGSGGGGKAGTRDRRGSDPGRARGPRVE